MCVCMCTRTSGVSLVYKYWRSDEGYISLKGNISKRIRASRIMIRYFTKGATRA